MGKTDSDGNIIPCYVYADNTLEAPERLEEIKKAMDKFGRPKILAEKNSMGATNIQMINKGGYRLEEFFTDRVKKNDITDFASMIVKRGEVRFPYKTPRDQKITDKLIHQLSGVKEKKTRTGKNSYDGTTKHDDYYIAFVLMVKHLFQSARPTKIQGFKRNELL